jgi:hypothetical protein
MYGARKSYSSKPRLYAQREVTFSDGNESDQSLQGPKASGNSH